VVERKIGKNVATEYDDCDQFVCSECGIELQDWRRVERDEDGLEVYYEYRFRFCPNCGMKIKEGDEDV
jgi:DNA-directed RNA polymerase subunit RPC12/RpoP